MPSSFARPGPRPGASAVCSHPPAPAGGFFCSLRAAAPSSVALARRPRSSAPPAALALRAKKPEPPRPLRLCLPFALCSCPAGGGSPCLAGACLLCRSRALLARWWGVGSSAAGGSRSASPPSGGRVPRPRRVLFFFCAPVRKLGKIRPQKTAKDPRFSGVFSSLDNIGGNFHAFLHEVAPSYPQEKFRFFAKKQDTPCKDCFSVLLSEW